jgi:hypothetical protein
VLSVQQLAEAFRCYAWEGGEGPVEVAETLRQFDLSEEVVVEVVRLLEAAPEPEVEL